ncbi:MAG: guanylate kinase [Lachnospiraceae bacterium]|nr:guanylate kinase [Lachnospiraceae bacterium]
MGKIFYLMGKSSSGKDTIYKLLLEKKELNLKTIVLYTTRPIRIGETAGVEYHFVSEDDLRDIEESGKLIELRAYNTFHGVWKYFTVADNQIDLERNDYLIIGTLESYNKTKKYYGEKYLVPIMIDLDDGIRLQRALDREKIQENPKYQEMCRRYLADDADFSEDKVKEANITRFFYNDDLEKCLKEIIQYMEENNLPRR